MTRLELLKLIIGRARTNGFNFRRWYTTRLALPWISNDAALQLLDSQRRYYALLFSHDFAGSFWKAGEDITFQVPLRNFQRVMPDGTVRNVSRKPYIRRSSRPDAWRYHLREMAAAEDPLRYLRKYVNVEEDLEAEPAPAERRSRAAQIAGKKAAANRAAANNAKKGRVLRPLPPGLPNFLKRPYGNPPGPPD